MIFYKKLYFTTLFFLFLLGSSPVFANMKEVQGLNFGNFAVQTNESPQVFKISPDGQSQYGEGIILLLEEPSQAVYEIDSLPPYSPISTIVKGSDLVLEKDGETVNVFTLTDFEVLSTNSNKSGISRVDIGASLKTSGDGSLYQEGVYAGTMDVTVNY